MGHSVLSWGCYERAFIAPSTFNILLWNFIFPATINTVVIHFSTPRGKPIKQEANK